MTLLEEVRLRLHTKMTLSLKDAELAATIVLEAVAKGCLEKGIILQDAPHLAGLRDAENRRWLGLAAEEKEHD